MSLSRRASTARLALTRHSARIHGCPARDARPIGSDTVGLRPETSEIRIGMKMDFSTLRLKHGLPRIIVWRWRRVPLRLRACSVVLRGLRGEILSGARLVLVRGSVNFTRRPRSTTEVRYAGAWCAGGTTDRVGAWAFRDQPANQCVPEAPDLDVDRCLNQNQFGPKARNVTGSTLAPAAIVAADAPITRDACSDSNSICLRSEPYARPGQPAANANRRAIGAPARGAFHHAVVGKPDPIRGEIVLAFVVLAKGYTASESLKVELQEHVKHTTAPYKYPREIEFVDDLPKTVSGKIRRVELRRRACRKDEG